MPPGRIVLGLVLVAALVPAGCKLVKTADEKPAETSGGATMFADDSAGLQKQAAEMWQPKVLPYVEEKAVDLAMLRQALANGFDDAGKAYGYREEGNGWNFAVRFSGTITEANTESRAATASIDTDGDGKADATLQLGPVIIGTSLRDLLPFVKFGDYKNQIAFAGIAKALNSYAYEHVLKPFPRDGLVGRKVEGIGAVTLNSASDAVRIIPVELKEARP